jgi:excisionase family DNA binding protein
MEDELTLRLPIQQVVDALRPVVEKLIEEAVEQHQTMLLTVKEVARELRCSTSTVYHLIAAGQLEAMEIGRQKRVARAVLQAFVAELAKPKWERQPVTAAGITKVTRHVRLTPSAPARLPPGRVRSPRPLDPEKLDSELMRNWRDTHRKLPMADAMRAFAAHCPTITEKQFHQLCQVATMASVREAFASGWFPTTTGEDGKRIADITDVAAFVDTDEGRHHLFA